VKQIPSCKYIHLLIKFLPHCGCQHLYCKEQYTPPLWVGLVWHLPTRLSQYRVVTLLWQQEKLQVVGLLSEKNKLNIKNWFNLISFWVIISQNTADSITFMRLQCVQRAAVQRTAVHRASIQGWAPGKLIGCEDDFSHLVWPSRRKFAYNEVHFKTLMTPL